MLLKALNLSRSEIGTSSIKITSTHEENEDAQLKEALCRSVCETHISQEGRAERFFASAEGMSYPEEDMAIVRQVLINFSQDCEAVLEALEILREERIKYHDGLEARKEAKEEKEQKRKREEYEKSMKDKGKGKVSLRALLQRKNHKVRSRLAQSPCLQNNRL